MPRVTESTVEEAALSWFVDLRYAIADARHLAPGEVSEYRRDDGKGQNNRRPDIVIFVNGLPLGIIELKIPEDTDKWFGAAYNQIQTYKQEIPSLMHHKEVTVISDGLEARIGSLTANQEWFKVWRTIEGDSHSCASNDL